jgi:hypothetical protein
MTSASDAAGNRPFGRRFCKAVAWIGTLGCVTLVFCGILFWAAVSPSQLRCSTWLDPIEKGAWAPAWMLAPMVALWAVSMCFGVVRWGWLARHYAGGAHRARNLGQSILTINFGWLLIFIIMAAASSSATPIVVALASCQTAR